MENISPVLANKEFFGDLKAIPYGQLIETEPVQTNVSDPPGQANASRPMSLIKRFGTMSQQWTIDTTMDTTMSKMQMRARISQFGPGYKKMLETLFNDWQKEKDVNTTQILASQITALVFVLYYKTRVRVAYKPNESDTFKSIQSALIGPGETSKYFLTVWYDKNDKCNFIIPDTYWGKIFVRLERISLETLIEASQLMPSTEILYATGCLDLKTTFYPFQFYDFPTKIDLANLNLLRTNQGLPETQTKGQDISIIFKNFLSDFWIMSFFESCTKANDEINNRNRTDRQLRTDYYSNAQDFKTCVWFERGSTCKGVWGSITSNFSKSKGGKTHRKNRKRSKKRKTKKTKTKRYKKIR